MVVLVAVAVAAAVLALLTAAVVTGSALLGIDDDVARSVAAHRPPALVAAARALTWLGSAAVLVPLTLAVGLATGLAARARAGGWRPLAALSLAGTGAWASMAVMKDLVARPRPDDALVAAGGWAFPSGHSADSAAWWLTAALVAAPWAPRARPALLAAGAAIALVVGATRVVLGVHHATDVVAGWALGVLWAGAAARLLAAPDRPPTAAR